MYIYPPRTTSQGIITHQVFLTLPTYLVLPSLTWLQCIRYDERDLVIRQKLHCILYSPQPFSLDVQPDDGLLEAETCSC